MIFTVVVPGLVDHFMKGCKHPMRLRARFDSFRKAVACTKYD